MIILGAGQMSRNPKVAVVILNHNGKFLAERCLRSVVASPYTNKEILLVDNASTDHSPEHLRTVFPDIVVLNNSENLGVAGGRNRGFREAVGRGNDYVLSLDNDAYIDPHLIDVELYGIVYIYNPVNRGQLGLDPAAGSVATPTAVPATIAISLTIAIASTITLAVIIAPAGGCL